MRQRRYSSSQARVRGGIRDRTSPLGTDRNSPLHRLQRAKGRTRGQPIRLTTNEWYKAAQLGDTYWLYVVWDPLGQPNPDPRIAAFEREILEAVNKTGIGPEGLGGRLPTHRPRPDQEQGDRDSAVDGQLGT